MVNLIGYWKMPRPQCNERYEEGCVSEVIVRESLLMNRFNVVEPSVFVWPIIKNRNE